MRFLLPSIALTIWGLWLSAAFGQPLPAGDVVGERALFRTVGALYDIDPSLLQAIATAESNNNSVAVSDMGAKGLMQLMPATALQFDVADAFDPVESALGAARLLDYLRGQIGRDLPQLLAAYNAGEGAVRRHHGIPPFPETREYVRKVLLLYLFGSAFSERSDSNRHAVDNSADAHGVVSEKSVNGDDAVLEQLDVLKRARAAAAQAH